MKSVQIEAKNVEVGARIITADGTPKKITEICKGIPRGFLEFRWNGGFAAVPPTKLVEIMV